MSVELSSYPCVDDFMTQNVNTIFYVINSKKVEELKVMVLKELQKLLVMYEVPNPNYNKRLEDRATINVLGKSLTIDSGKLIHNQILAINELFVQVELTLHNDEPIYVVSYGHFSSRTQIILVVSIKYNLAKSHFLEEDLKQSLVIRLNDAMMSIPNYREDITKNFEELYSGTKQLLISNGLVEEQGGYLIKTEKFDLFNI